MHDKFERDSQLIDKLIVINAGLSGDRDLIKQAGIVDSLGGMAESIKQAVADRVKQEGTIGAAATYLVPFLLSGPLRWITLIAYWFFDVSVGSLLKKAFDAAQGTIDEKGDFTEADASKVAEDVTAPVVKAASLEPLYELEKKGLLVAAMEGKLINTAQRSRYRRSPGIWGRIKNIFRSLGRGKSKILAGGFIRWFIKAALLGVAAIEGPRLLGIKDDPNAAEAPAQAPAQQQGEVLNMPGVPKWLMGLLPGGRMPSQTRPARPSYNLPPKIPHKLKLNTGNRGTEYHVNRTPTMWFVRLSGNVARTLLAWAVTIYPELRGHEAQIRSSKSFNTMVSRLGTKYSADTPGYLQILPDSGLHTWKDIVDHFAGEVAQKIKKA